MEENSESALSEISKEKLRWHIVLMITVITLVCALINELMYRYLTQILLVRTLTTFALGYCLLFVAIHIWLKVQEKNKNLLSFIKTPTDSEFKPHWNPSGIELFLNPFGWILVIIFLVGFSLYQLPLIISEAAFEFALLAGLTKVAGKNGRDWLEHVFEKTIWPFLVMFLCVALASFYITTECPDQNRLYDVARQCFKAKQNATANSFEH